MKLTAKNKNRIFFGIIVLFSILLITVLYMVDKESFNPKRICFQENCFSIEIADTAEERAQGLMFRQELAKDKGMLFVFQNKAFTAFG